MKYVRYQSLGNSIGLEEDIDDYWEIDSDGYVLRSVHVLPDGLLLKYSEDKPSDHFGVLPEGVISDEMLADKSAGIITVISRAIFESRWAEKAKNA